MARVARFLSLTTPVGVRLVANPESRNHASSPRTSRDTARIGLWAEVERLAKALSLQRASYECRLQVLEMELARHRRGITVEMEG